MEAGQEALELGQGRGSARSHGTSGALQVIIFNATSRSVRFAADGLGRFFVMLCGVDTNEGVGVCRARGCSRIPGTALGKGAAHCGTSKGTVDASFGIADPSPMGCTCTCISFASWSVPIKKARDKSSPSKSSRTRWSTEGRRTLYTRQLSRVRMRVNW